jgi:hypothetical protein
MSADMLGIGRKTLGSHTVVIHERRMRNRAGVLPQMLLVSFRIASPQEEELSGPVQSSGNSQQSQQIGDGSSGVPGGYLTKRLIKAPNNALPRFRTL